jgi:CubicO group peptidase (beta-lactamase class C family)
MNAAHRNFVLALAVLVLGSAALAFEAAERKPATELAGLWEAKRHFGPEVRGTLLVARNASVWRAEIAGRSAFAKVADDAITFELADGKGAFKGKFADGRAKITGHWIQPARVENGREYATPVVLTQHGSDLWRGEVLPLDDEMTLYLMVKVRDDGQVEAFLRNPERNLGGLFEGIFVELDGDIVRLVREGGAGANGRSLADGIYRKGKLRLIMPGGTFDFRRVKADGASDFYPRGRPSVPYAYSPPPPLGDGWPVATLEDVGISRDGVQKFIQMIVDTPINSLHAQEVHGVLIARHGKLVVEEYFHGEHRDKLHDTRSAAKSLTSTLTGAAIRAGVPLDVATPVYRVMNGGTFAPGLDERKRALTVEHLLTMSSGLDCDDRDASSVGNEDVMQSQTAQPDWYRYALDLRMVRNPGEKSVYGGANPHLLGGVLAKAAGRPLPVLFQELLAEPLGIKHYAMNLAPTGDAYMGGGVRFGPRDFMKLGQLMLNEGTWNGRQILTPEWCRRATAPLYELRGIHYGYLWWVVELPHKGRTVRAFFAGGNGGQVVMGIPELDLLVAFYGGNYSDPVLYVPQREYVPKYILPAVDAGG